MSPTSPLQPKAIGLVKNHITDLREDWAEVISEIVLKKAWAEALDGIEGFSHLVVLFWLHRVEKEKRAIKRLHPKDRQDLPLVGVFATRSQYRPNPIGMTVVKLLERKGNVLRVLGLDALDGTPVLDLKPYLPALEASDEVRVPDWTQKLR